MQPPNKMTEAHLRAMSGLFTSVLGVCDVFHYRATPLCDKVSILPGEG